VLPSLNDAEYEKAAELIAGRKTFSREQIIAGAREYYDLASAIQKYVYVYKKILG
jgi:hypothetical protein